MILALTSSTNQHDSRLLVLPESMTPVKSPTKRHRAWCLSTDGIGSLQFSTWHLLPSVLTCIPSQPPLYPTHADLLLPCRLAALRKPTCLLEAGRSTGSACKTEGGCFSGFSLSIIALAHYRPSILWLFCLACLVCLTSARKKKVRWPRQARRNSPV